MYARLDIPGPAPDLAALRTTIAAVVAGEPVTLRQVSLTPLPDRDGFGGTRALVLEAEGVRVEEVIASGEDGCARDGYGYRLTWTFTGLGPRAGCEARINTFAMEPRLDGFTVTVTRAEAEALRAALHTLLGRAPRVW